MLRVRRIGGGRGRACQTGRLGLGACRIVGKRAGYASESEPSRHITFYKEFGRPIGTTLLLASVTYMSLHWLWWRLELDDTKDTKSAEIRELESKVLQGS